MAKLTVVELEAGWLALTQILFVERREQEE
jgi:hypothetical protein